MLFTHGLVPPPRNKRANVTSFFFRHAPYIYLNNVTILDEDFQNSAIRRQFTVRESLYLRFEIISFIEQIPFIFFELPFRFLAQLTVVFARDPRARRKNTEIPVRGVRGVTFFLTWKRTITRSPDLIKTQMPRRGTYNTAG